MGPETAYAQRRRQGQSIGQAGRSFRKTALGCKANLYPRVSWGERFGLWESSSELAIGSKCIVFKDLPMPRRKHSPNPSVPPPNLVTTLRVVTHALTLCVAASP